MIVLRESYLDRTTEVPGQLGTSSGSSRRRRRSR